LQIYRKSSKLWIADTPALLRDARGRPQFVRGCGAATDAPEIGLDQLFFVGLHGHLHRIEKMAWTIRRVKTIVVWDGCDRRWFRSSEEMT
jgi:hypothetical protein